MSDCPSPSASKIQTAAQRRARSWTLALCALLLLTCIFGVYRYTDGLKIWTFEGQRQEAVRQGRLQAASVPLFENANRPVALWSEAKTQTQPGEVYLVAFIYTSCTTVCTVLGDEYRRMQNQLQDWEQEHGQETGIRLVSVSFDPEVDDEINLRAYARQHQLDPRQWTLAVPGNAEEARRIMQSLQVISIPDGMGGYVHNGAIHLLDAKGHLHGLYDYEQWQEALLAAQRLAAVQGQPRKEAG